MAVCEKSSDVMRWGLGTHCESCILVQILVKKIAGIVLYCGEGGMSRVPVECGLEKPDGVLVVGFMVSHSVEDVQHPRPLSHCEPRITPRGSLSGS